MNIVTISGPPGSGKSYIAHAAAAHLIQGVLEAPALTAFGRLDAIQEHIDEGKKFIFFDEVKDEFHHFLMTQVSDDVPLTFVLIEESK